MNDGDRARDLCREVRRCTLFNGDTPGPAIRLKGSAALLLEESIVWGLAAQEIQADALATVSATYSDVRTGGAPLPGAGNLAQDPLFVDPAQLDLRLSSVSPCVEAGDPVLLPLGADIDRDSRVLDGALRIDLGANEFAPIHLEVLGTPAVGNTLTFVTAGTSGLAAFLWIGRPGLHFVPRAGELFLSTVGVFRSPWPVTPSSAQVLVPPGVLGLYHVQEIALGGGARTLSNFVPLTF